MFIAIDSAKGMCYTGVISGFMSELNRIYDEAKKIFSECGVKDPLHWNKISRKVKEKCKKDIIELLNESMVNFNVFIHIKPKKALRKDYYIYQVPNAISEHLEHWFRYKRGSVEILVDNDYNFGSSCTNDFIENLLRQITFRLIGRMTAIRKENKLKATVKFPNGNILDFYASTTDIKRSKEIQIVDIFLGYYIENPELFDKKKVYTRKV